MTQTGPDFYKVLFEDLDPKNLARRFLELLLEIQGVDRGSIWVKQGKGYRCIEAIGGDALKSDIRGTFIPADQSTLIGWVIENAKMTVADAGEDPRHFKAFEETFAVKSTCILCYPLILRDDEVFGAIQIIETGSGGNRMNLDEKFLKLLQSIIDVGSVALNNAMHFTRQLKKNEELETTLEKIRADAQIVGQSKPILDVMKRVRDYAHTDFPVLITGESGTGKDLVAKALHGLSSRKDKPYVVQNCSAIPQTLLESELFGYKKGAFTGATENKIGLFKAADKGTIFLDEIGDMDIALQARVLRVIENGEVKPLGDVKARKVDVRVISATNKNLEQAILDKHFRQDLYYRLNVLPLWLPPLRDRKMDIPLLLNYFFKRESLRLGILQKTLSREATRYLQDYAWEGNIRELENFVKFIISTVDKDVIGIKELPIAMLQKESHPDGVTGTVQDDILPTMSHERSSEPGEHFTFEGLTWRKLEKAYVTYLMSKNRWNISRAAREADVNRSTFDSRMKKLGIRKG